MKSIYNTNWFIVIRGLFYKNGVNLTFAVSHQTHDCFSWKLGAGTAHTLINYYRSIIGLDSTCSFSKKTRE